VPIEIMPGDAGLVLDDAYGHGLPREAPEFRIAAAAGRAVLIRLAQVTAHRLHRLSDPEVVAGGS
jgi:hypothetical protein